MRARLLSLLLLAACALCAMCAAPARPLPAPAPRPAPVASAPGDAGPGDAGSSDVGAGDVGAGDAAAYAPAALRECDPPPPADVIAATASVPFDDVLVQLDVDDRPLVRIRAGASAPFSRIPPFTLLRDGTVLRRVDKDISESLVVGKISPSDAVAFTRHLLDLGAGQLESHTSDCSCVGPKGIRVCMSDANVEIFRIRDGDTLKHSLVYGGMWFDAKIAHDVLAAVAAFRAPGERPYVPTRATLAFILQEQLPLRECRPLPKALERLFDRPAAGRYHWLRAIDGADLAALGKHVDANVNPVCVGRKVVWATIYPWLPGADHDAAIRAWQQRVLAPPVE